MHRQEEKAQKYIKGGNPLKNPFAKSKVKVQDDSNKAILKHRGVSIVSNTNMLDSANNDKSKMNDKSRIQSNFTSNKIVNQKAG